MTSFIPTLTILGSGTSTGVPIPGCQCSVCTSSNPKNKRLRTSALLSLNTQCNILIDTTTDFRAQALRADIRHVQAVLFTHAHADHILGIDDLRAFNFIQRSAIPCYGSTRTLLEIKKLFSYVFNPDPDYIGGGIPRLELHEIDELQEFIINGFRITPFPMLHGRLPVTGYRIGDCAYATDVKTIPESSLDKLRGLKTLFLDGLRMEDHPAHLTIPEAISLAQKIKAEKTYLIHMTHTVNFEEINQDLPEGIELAYDGLVVNLTL